jgi:hypothetical protein
MGLRPLASWDWGFEFRRRHDCLSLVSVVSCQVEVSESGWSPVRRSPTKCGVCNWVWSWSLDNEALTHYGLLHHEKGIYNSWAKIPRTWGLVLKMIYWRTLAAARRYNKKVESVYLNDKGCISPSLRSALTCYINSEILILKFYN